MNTTERRILLELAAELDEAVEVVGDTCDEVAKDLRRLAFANTTDDRPRRPPLDTFKITLA